MYDNRINNYINLNKLVDYYLMNMFSNIKVRLLSSLIINPEIFKNVTLLLDGHNSTVEYNKPDIEYQKKWSYKLKKSGIT